MLATVIVGVSLATVILGWMMWRGWKSAESAETDLRQRRRIFLRLGLIYVAAVAIGIAGVLSGREPKESLIGLPIALLLAWFWLRTGLRVKVPPGSRR
jgi:4-amino-4-deoxy-L-arabinose transferase-like glycosyltransferase